MTAAEDEIMDDDILPSIDTLYGDLRSAILDRLRAMPKPWTVMSESEQRETIEGINRVAHHLVINAVRLVAANGHPVLPGILQQTVVKDGLKATIVLSREDPQRETLLDHTGKTVLVVMADMDAYMGERKPENPDPDEPELSSEDGDMTTVTAMRGKRDKKD